ncbi:MAG: flagellar motor protein MotB [Alphaproteobacteria bacterium]
MMQHGDQEKNLFSAAPPPAVNQNWLITFCDLMSLMLAFFVMLFSMSQLQTQAWKSIVSGLSDELSPGRERAILEVKEDARPLRILEPKGIDLGYLEAVIREKFRNHAVLAGARIQGRPDRVVIALPVDMLFMPELAQPAPTAAAVLETVGQSLSSIKNRVEIHVYSDNGDRPALSDGGGFVSAWELSLSRAVAAKRLLAQGGQSLSIIPVGHSVTPDAAPAAGDVVELVIRELVSK